ncbi:hypothetical protein ACGLHS_00490 [Variovorax sp. VaC1]|uniref:hypothetical protein n=1 Tax=Variovorax sp. VaC1 TaxID=3373132 RepID=UPI0037495876
MGAHQIGALELCDAHISAHEWLLLLDRRMQLRKRWHRLFESFDVVIAPPFGTAALEHMVDPD